MKKIRSNDSMYEIRAARIGEEIACAVFRDDEYLDALSMLTTSSGMPGSLQETLAIADLTSQMTRLLTGLTD